MKAFVFHLSTPGARGAALCVAIKESSSGRGVGLGAELPNGARELNVGLSLKGWGAADEKTPCSYWKRASRQRSALTRHWLVSHSLHTFQSVAGLVASTQV